MNAVPPVTPANLESQLTSESLDLKHAGDVWGFTFKDKTIPFARAKISLQDSTGLANPAYSIAIPYYWESALPIQLAVPAVKAQSSDDYTNDFVNGATANLTTSELIAFNTQARAIWQTRFARFRSVVPERVDARLAYWVLQSSAALGQKIFQETDPVTQSAVKWMRQSLVEARKNGFFGVGGVNMKDAQAAIDAISNRDKSLYSAIINRITMDVADRKKSDRACTVVNSLDGFYDAMMDSPNDSYAGWQTHQIIAATDRAYCMTVEANRATQQGGKLAAEKIQEAKDLLDKLAKLGKNAALETSALANAKARAADLQSKIGST